MNKINNFLNSITYEQLGMYFSFMMFIIFFIIGLIDRL